MCVRLPGSLYRREPCTESLTTRSRSYKERRGQVNDIHWHDENVVVAAAVFAVGGSRGRWWAWRRRSLYSAEAQEVRLLGHRISERSGLQRPGFEGRGPGLVGDIGSGVSERWDSLRWHRHVAYVRVSECLLQRHRTRRRRSWCSFYHPLHHYSAPSRQVCSHRAACHWQRWRYGRTLNFSKQFLF